MTTREAPRRILHLDADAMFVQVAVMSDPRLAAEPLLIVGGRPESRGVVTSASYAAREYGVRSGMSMSEALRRCPGAVRVDVPRKEIGEVSRALHAVLERWAPVYQALSVDEGALDLTGCEALYQHETLRETALRIQRSVMDEVGLKCSLGGGTNRLVAKLATSRAKPAGVYVVAPGQELAFLDTFALSDIPHFGPVLVTELERSGIRTVADLRARDESALAQRFGRDRARWLWERCRGIDRSPVHTGDAPKSFSAERTFPKDLYSQDDMEAALLHLVTEAASALREEGAAARTISVKLRDSARKDRQKSRTLGEPLRTDRAIFEVVRELLDALLKQQRSAARLLGVTLSSLRGSGESEQASFLEIAPPLETEKDRALARVTDTLRAKFGQSAILPGRILGRSDSD